MQKILILLFIYTFYLQDGEAQGITKTAKGEGTVLFKGNSIALDIGETEASFGFNNLQQSLGKDKKLIWGANVKAKNESGIAGLFSRGNFVPASTLNLFAGYSISNGLPKGVNASYKKAITRYENYIVEADVSFTARIKSTLQTEVSDETLGELRYELFKKLEASRTQEAFINYVAGLKPEREPEKAAVKSLVEKLKKILENFKAELNTYERAISSIEVKLDTSSVYWQAMFFGFGGISASEFKYFKGIDTLVLSNSFTDQYFRGGHFGVGANFQYGRFMIGATYNYRKTNNFTLLSDKDYTLRLANTVNNQTLIQEKKITGYSGAYGEVEINEFAFDFLWREKLDPEAKNNLLINPYVKGQMFSRNKELLPNSTNIGVGFYYFQNTGKFLGGVYLEMPDIKQNYERAKPLTEQSLRRPFERLSFGLVGRISIGSFLNWF